MRRRLVSGLAPVLLVALAACGGGDPLANDSGGDSGGDSSSLIIGSAIFPENELLAEIYAQALEAKGVTVERQFNIGARELYLKALEDGSIDLLPEYNGALLAFQSPDGPPEGVTAPQDVYDAVVDVLPDGIIALEQSDAEDKDTLTVTQDTATQYNLTTIEDLAPVAGELSVAAGPEFAERFQGLVGLEEVYGITFAEFTPLDAGGPLTLEALLSGQVDVSNIFSTDSAIQTENLVVLEDTKNLFLAQNIVPIIRKDKSSDTIESALNAVSAALTTENLTAALAQVTVDKMSSADVAQQFLADNGLT